MATPAQFTPDTLTLADHGTQPPGTSSSIAELRPAHVERGGIVLSQQSENASIVGWSWAGETSSMPFLRSASAFDRITATRVRPAGAGSGWQQRFPM
ncbi:MAG: hypothetical protein R3E68_08960 [Burkholderiaceae bacterium]